MSAGPRRAGRLVIGGALLPAALILGSVLPLLLAWGDLPDPMASHWGLGAEPNGSMPRSLVAALTVGLAVPPSIWLAVQVLASRSRSRPGGGFGPATAAFVGGMGAGLSIILVDANAGVPTWRGASLRAWHLPLLLLGSALTGLIGAWATPRRDRFDHRARVTATPGHRGPAGSASWRGRARARGPIRALAPLSVAVLAAVVVSGSGPTIWIVLATTVTVVVAVIPFSSVTVEVEPTGVSIRFGPLGIPRSQVDIDQITAVEAFDLRPRDWGGWGYRGSRRLAGRAAIVVRAGPAIRFGLRDGSVLAVTVDDAERGAAAIAANIGHGSA